MESAEPAPEGLLARVRATTRASIEGASTRQPSRASPRAPKTSLWDSLRSWLHQPAVAGGVFALLVLTFALLLVNQPMGPLMDPDLLPRGANFDQERLRAAVPAVTDSGVYFRGSNARFFLLRGLESEAVERTPAWIDLAAFETVQQGAYVALITTTGAVLPATVVRTGRGAVQTDQLNYSGRLLALTPISAQGETPTGVGTAVLNSDGGLIAVIIGQADDGAFLAAPPPE